jgi:hypothetical protein
LVRMTVDDDQDDVPEEVRDELKAMHTERKGLETRIELIKAESNDTALHPQAIKAFAKSVETLATKLKRYPDDDECRMAFGNIIGRVVVTRPRTVNRTTSASMLGFPLLWAASTSSRPRAQLKKSLRHRDILAYRLRQT